MVLYLSKRQAWPMLFERNHAHTTTLVGVKRPH
jgi:hypothetical protein